MEVDLTCGPAAASVWIAPCPCLRWALRAPAAQGVGSLWPPSQGTPPAAYAFTPCCHQWSWLLSGDKGAQVPGLSLCHLEGHLLPASPCRSVYAHASLFIKVSGAQPAFIRPGFPPCTQRSHTQPEGLGVRTQHRNGAGGREWQQFNPEHPECRRGHSNPLSSKSLIAFIHPLIHSFTGCLPRGNPGDCSLLFMSAPRAQSLPTPAVPGSNTRELPINVYSREGREE